MPERCRAIKSPPKQTFLLCASPCRAGPSQNFPSDIRSARRPHNTSMKRNKSVPAQTVFKRKKTAIRTRDNSRLRQIEMFLQNADPMRRRDKFGKRHFPTSAMRRIWRIPIQSTRTYRKKISLSAGVKQNRLTDYTRQVIPPSATIAWPVM